MAAQLTTDPVSSQLVVDRQSMPQTTIKTSVKSESKASFCRLAIAAGATQNAIHVLVFV
jgi:hypothetical protein